MIAFFGLSDTYNIYNQISLPYRELDMKFNAYDVILE